MSHGLRFDVRRAGESTDDFRRRLNKLAEDEEANRDAQAGEEPEWLVGARGRSSGSLHADFWTGTAADLADSGVVGVYPVGGWWKNNNRRDRVQTPVRYALVVSLQTDDIDVDLYTPIAVQIHIAIEVAV